MRNHEREIRIDSIRHLKDQINTNLQLQDKKISKYSQVLQVRQCRGDKQKNKQFLVPAYLKLTILNINQLDLQKLNQEIYCVFYLAVNYGNLDNEIISTIYQNISVTLNYAKTVKLVSEDSQQDSDNLNNFIMDTQNQIMFFIFTQQISMKIRPQTFFTPFQRIFSNVIVSLNQIIENNQETKIQIKFNLMDHQLMEYKFFYKNELYFKVYDLAQQKLNVVFSDEPEDQFKEIYMWHKSNQKNKQTLRFEEQQKAQKQKNKEKDNYTIEKSKSDQQPILNIKTTSEGQQQQQRQLSDEGNNTDFQNKLSRFKKKDFSELKTFKYANYSFMLYKTPETSLVKIFIPIWLLGIINLGIFFQDNNLSGRIASIAGLLIAFVSFVSAVRKELPASKKITFVEILIILQAFTSLLCFIESVNVRNEENFIFQWKQSGLFLLSAIITSFSILSVLTAWIVYKITIQTLYNLNSNHNQLQFDKYQWKPIDICQRKMANFQIYVRLEKIKKDKVKGLQYTHFKKSKKLLKQN